MKSNDGIALGYLATQEGYRTQPFGAADLLLILEDNADAAVLRSACFIWAKDSLNGRVR